MKPVLSVDASKIKEHLRPPPLMMLLNQGTIGVSSTHDASMLSVFQIILFIDVCSKRAVCFRKGRLNC